MEKKKIVISSLLITGVSILIVYLFSVSTSPLYRYVFIDRDIWYFLLGRMGAESCVLYRDYSDTIGPACSIIFTMLTDFGGKIMFFIAESIVLSSILILCFRMYTLRHMNRTERFFGILFAICMYIAISHYCGMTDRFFGILTETVLLWFLNDTSMTAGAGIAKTGAVITGACFVIGLFARFDPALLLLVLIIIVRNKKNSKYLFCGTFLAVFIMITGMLCVSSADVQYMFDWWVKAQILECRFWIAWIYPCGIYLYIHFVECAKKVISNPEYPGYDRLIRRFILLSIVLITVSILSMGETLNAGDTNVSYLAGGYEEDRYNAFVKMHEKIPVEERENIVGFADTAGFFAANRLIPGNKLFLNRSGLYNVFPGLDTELAHTVSDEHYRWVICCIKQGEYEAEARKVLKAHFEVALASHGYQLWERKE